MADGNGDAFVRISNREIWDKLEHLDKTVSRMDDRMNTILTENVSLSKRVRSLEIKVYGVLAGTGGLLATALAVIFRGRATV